MKRFILFIFTILYVVCLFPQKTVVVNARIETEHQVWTLDSIKLNEDDTELYWHVESKSDTWFKIDSNSCIKNIKTLRQYCLKEVQGLSLMSDSIYLQNYEIINFVEKFPNIVDIGDLYDFYVSENFYIKEINLYTGKFKKTSSYQILSKAKKDSLNMSNLLFEYGIELHSKEKYQEAIEVFKRVSTIDSLLFNKDYINFFYNNNRKNPYAENYAEQWISNCYYKLGLDSLVSFPILNKKYKINTPVNRKYIVESDSLLIRYPQLGINPKNKDLYFNAYKYICKLDSINLGEDSFRYVESLCKLAAIYDYTNQHDMSNTIYLYILKNKKYFNDPNDKYYDIELHSDLLSKIARNYYEKGDYINAISYMESYFKINGGVELLNYADIKYSVNLSELINSYVAIGQSEKALKILHKRKCIAEDKYLMDSTEIHSYTNSVMDYAEILSNLGFYKEALRNYKKIENFIVLSNLNVNIGNAYLNVFNYEKAEEFFLKAIENKSNDSTYSELDKFFTSDTYNSLAILEYKKGNVNKTINYLKTALDMYEWEVDEIDSNLYFFSSIGLFSYPKPELISNLAMAYLSINQINKAIECEMRNIAYKNTFMSSNYSELGISYVNLGHAYSIKNEMSKALEYTKKGYDLINKGASDLRQALTNLINLNFVLNNKPEAEKYILELNRINTKRLRRLFTELTYQEKKRFLDKDCQYFFDFLPKYTCLLGSDILIKELYNGILLSKGILLSSDIEMRDIIENSKDSLLVQDYYRLQYFKRSIIKEMGNCGNEAIIDSLSNIANELEDSLILKSKEYGNYMQKQSITWEDIKQQLSPQSVAIEFINFKLENDNVIYAALVLKNNYSCPKLVELCNSTSIKNISIRDSYLISTLDNLIWEPLKEELSDVDNIFFSPSGLLHNIAIELTPSMRNYNLYRLSSTRELITNKRYSGNIKTAALFGGMKYNSKIDKCYYSTKSDYLSLTSTRGFEDFPDRGVLYSELPLTRAEINKAESYLKKLKYKCIPFVGKDGIEESFKSLSGKSINWIHLATHGGYIIPETNTKDSRNYNFIINFDKDIYAEDVSLTHSFLAFTGCNSTLKGSTIPENTEDGILTAQEISQLHFKDLDMVILSACKTGLGKISEEGVYGLQRGFKKAGAKSILMSLWDVNDKATYDYMSLFYKFYSKNNNIKYAYDMAQKTMREKYPNNPEYWAAFILLDGV